MTEPQPHVPQMRPQVHVTAPLPHTGPVLPAYAWAPQAEPQRKGLGLASVGLGAAALLASFVFGLLAPLGLIAVALGILAVVRRSESTLLGGWGIALGALAVLYGAGWLWYAFSVA